MTTDSVFGFLANAQGMASAGSMKSTTSVAHAEISTGGFDAASAFAAVVAAFEVVQDRASPATSVPLIIEGKLTAHVSANRALATDGVTAIALLQIGDLMERIVAQCDPVHDFCDPDMVDPFVVTISGTPGTVETVILIANVNGGAENGGSGLGASASVDPTIIIDPNFPFKNDFHLVFSDNLFAPSAPVPAPASWILLLAGGSLIGLLVGWVRWAAAERVGPRGT